MRPSQCSSTAAWLLERHATGGGELWKRVRLHWEDSWLVSMWCNLFQDVFFFCSIIVSQTEQSWSSFCGSESDRNERVLCVKTVHRWSGLDASVVGRKVWTGTKAKSITVGATTQTSCCSHLKQTGCGVFSQSELSAEGNKEKELLGFHLKKLVIH